MGMFPAPKDQSMSPKQDAEVLQLALKDPHFRQVLVPHLDAIGCSQNLDPQLLQALAPHLETLRQECAAVFDSDDSDHPVPESLDSSVLAEEPTSDDLPS